MAVTPKVSIGMPVYNGQKDIRRAVDCLLEQTFTDFELIISDNASTDETQAICLEYAQKDPRIRYIRQPENQGIGANFYFVLVQARGEYFMWNACDDTRSKDFIEVNLKFLLANPDYVASTSPDCFDFRSSNKDNFSTFSLDGDVYHRINGFFEHCWKSHGIYFSLMRTKVLKGCEAIGWKSFIGQDWAASLYVACHGKMHRSSEGSIIIGSKGISMQKGHLRAFRKSFIEFILPLYWVDRYVMGLIVDFPLSKKAKILYTLMRVNLTASFGLVCNALSERLHFLKGDR